MQDAPEPSGNASSEPSQYPAATTEATPTVESGFDTPQTASFPADVPALVTSPSPEAVQMVQAAKTRLKDEATRLMALAEQFEPVQRAVKSVVEKPLKSLLITFGAGILVGLALRR